MFRFRLACAAVAMALASAAAVHADPIISVGSSPITVGPGIGGPTNQYLAVSWTQTSTFTDVTVRVHGFSINPAFDDGTAWLTQHIGPGTPPGSELAESAFTFPPVDDWVTLFSGVTLGPGTWYLILSAPSYANGPFLGWVNGEGPPMTGNGVTANPTLLTAGNWANTGYAPASNWGGTYPSVAFAVRGTEVPNAVPEPASMLLLGSGLIGLVRIARRPRAS